MNNEENCVKANWSCYLIKIDRISAWILLIVVVLYGITGYGMTKGLINPDIANSLHLSWLGGIGLLAFVIHTAWAIHLFFKRHRAWNIFSQIFLILCYVSLVTFFLWAHFFYQFNDKYSQYFVPVQTDDVTGNVDVGAPVNNTVTTSVSPITQTDVFTATNLSQYDGLNGRPAYVAVDGVVYDMSSVYRNGQHYGYPAGQDLSAEFHRKHPASYLQRVPVVGTYQK